MNQQLLRDDDQSQGALRWNLKHSLSRTWVQSVARTLYHCLFCLKNPITPTGELDPKGQRGEPNDASSSKIKVLRPCHQWKSYGQNKHSLSVANSECDFNAEMNIEVTRRPRNVVVEIWEKSGILGSL